MGGLALESAQALSGLKPLVTAIEDRAAQTPHHTFIRYPDKDWERKGYSTVTCKQFVDSINKIAHSVQELLGSCSTNETVCFSGPSDLRYGLILPALVKTNRKLLICDGRITGEGLTRLLEATECRVWFYSDEHWTLESAGVQDDNIKQHAFPTLEWCLDAAETRSFPYNKTWEEAKHDEISIIHTSGTTGFPKPIFLSNGYLGIAGLNKLVSKTYWPRSTVYEVQRNKVAISAYSPKWAAGIVYMTCMPAYANHITVLLPPDTVGLPPALFRDVVRWNPDIDGLHSAPQPIQALWNDPTTQPLLKQLDFVVYGGAPMDPAIGDEMALHTRLLPFLAATETGVRYWTLALDRKLWSSFAYVPEGPHHFIKREGTAGASAATSEGSGDSSSSSSSSSSDDLYELVFDRPAPGQPSYFHGAFWNLRWYRDADSVETRELYAPVTDLDGSTRWVFKARTDDLTKLSYLAKFNATHIEARILRHPDVKHVLVGGEGRPVPYVLIEPTEQAVAAKSESLLLESIYKDTVALANKDDVREIRIPRETVFLASKEKPLTINLKAQVLRREVEKAYEKEINDIYTYFERASRQA